MAVWHGPAEQLGIAKASIVNSDQLALHQHVVNTRVDTHVCDTHPA